jgi:tRNA(Ile)-lysidine synthase TilS/MesJ
VIPSVLLGNVRSTVVEYGLLVPGEEIMVAFSGGKDSLALALCLSELGYRVRSVAVDMGYDSGWASRIQALAAVAGFDVEVLDVRAGLAQFIPPPERREIRMRLGVLNELGVRETGVVTPCTHCYNSKVIALDNVVRHAGKQKIAFGHHRTDACASLLKEALLRIDRFDRGHERYARGNFESLVAELAAEAESYPAGPGPLLERIIELVADRHVDTDEPPRQPLRTDREGTEIIRPLFYVWEEDLAQLAVDLHLLPEASGCGHSAASETETMREMVHYRVLRNPAARAFRTRLAALVASSVACSGYGVRRSRYHRADDLGVAYRRQPPISDKL